MTVSHTPGPWACTYTSNHAHDYRITRANGLKLPLVVIANDHSEQRANARLIGAAPDLLEALQNALEVIENEGDAFWTDVADKAHAAIAKAKEQA